MAKPISSTPTLKGKDAERFLQRMLETEKKPISKKDKKLAEDIKKNRKYFKVKTIKDTLHLTEKQNKELEESLRINEFETIYTCEKCNKKLKGLIEVRKHHEEEKHYSYKSANGGTLGFV